MAPGTRPGRGGGLVGNVLDASAVASDPGLNFVDADALGAAQRRAREVQREGGTLEQDRLFHNLLSSMPMCFNLFGALAPKPGFIELVRELLDAEAAEIDDVVCEITPTSRLGDRTAFDAMIRYRVGNGDRRFIGIETKYTEPFSPTRYDTDTYRRVTAESGWFLPGAADALVGSKTNQLWRGLMLASLVEQDTGATGTYLVVSTADDTAAIEATRSVAEQLTDPARLRFVGIEQFVGAASNQDEPALHRWAERFARRYLLSPESVSPEH